MFSLIEFKKSVPAVLPSWKCVKCCTAKDKNLTLMIMSANGSFMINNNKPFVDMNATELQTGSQFDECLWSVDRVGMIKSS